MAHVESAPCVVVPRMTDPCHDAVRSSAVTHPESLSSCEQRAEQIGDYAIIGDCRSAALVSRTARSTGCACRTSPLPRCSARCWIVSEAADFCWVRACRRRPRAAICRARTCSKRHFGRTTDRYGWWIACRSLRERAAAGLRNVALGGRHRGARAGSHRDRLAARLRSQACATATARPEAVDLDVGR